MDTRAARAERREASQAGDLKPSPSFFGKKRAPKAKLPPNWKEAKDEGGTYYLNTVTQQKSRAVPPPLPAGWCEALHKESGRVYYFHKLTRRSTFEIPTADDIEFPDEILEEPSSLMGKVFASFAIGKKKDGLGRTATLAKKGGARGGAKAEERRAAKGATSGGDGDVNGDHTVVSISAATLIKEVKLCVGEEQLERLDALFAKLTAHAIPADQAVKNLIGLVGLELVQQAGLSVMNCRKRVLPHGWLEYTDKAPGRADRPYFFNIHTKVTTWYKPTSGPPPPVDYDMDVGDDDDGISLDCTTLDTHEVVMSGSI